MKSKILISLLVAGAALCSCEPLSEINTNPNSPMEVPASLLLPKVCQDAFTRGTDGMYADKMVIQTDGHSEDQFFEWNRGSFDTYNNELLQLEKLKEEAMRTGDTVYLPLYKFMRSFHFYELTLRFGDIPYSDALKGQTEAYYNPKYDTQEEVYDFIFSELKACAAQLGTGNDAISGDVTSLGGNPEAWKRYANTLRLRYAMRISDVAPERARTEFESALNADGGIISSANEDAYIKYIDAPFTLYDGAADLDFRANALSEMIYGQDPQSPSFVSSTLFDYMKKMHDPRLYRIARCYIHTTRSQTDTSGNFDVTDEVLAWGERGGEGIVPCNVGDAWWSDWVSAPANSDIPTLDSLATLYPDKGYDKNNYPARMIRPTIAVAFCNADCPGILITSAEVEFLLAEAASKGWNVTGDAESHYEAGIRASMQMLNNHYDIVSKISDEEIEEYIAENPLGGNPRESINTQAWILHLTNPNEGWANLRRSDYPALADRTLLPVRGDFPHEDPNMQTPVRLRYPLLEARYNSVNYEEAVDRLGGTDDWHTRVWWDVNEQHFMDIEKFSESIE